MSMNKSSDIEIIETVSLFEEMPLKVGLLAELKTRSLEY